ncbi:ribosome-associated translation inhibitor RaiA [Anaerolineae bacterium CFX9]|jgi:putative sigma-54 modulation protein|nr:ribosome-associated translation inhibitor RaiA [Anaerolineae bacterium CFX9]
MDISINGRNLRITEALEEYTRKKLGRLDRYLPNIADVRVDFTRQNTKRGEDLSVAQITIRHARGAILRAEEQTSGEPQAALNLAVDKMYRQIQRFKGKRSRKGRERFVATIEELDIAEELPTEEIPAVDAEHVAEPEIIRRKDITVTTMTEEEAIEQMELLGHTFFVFHNAATDSINVIYKRKMGDYGVLNPTVM